MKLVTLLMILSFSVFAQENTVCVGAQSDADPSVVVELEQNVANSVLDQELVDAIKRNDLEKLKELLEDGVDPNTIHKGKLGGKDKPVLFLALEHQNMDAFKMLLAYGADPQPEKTSDLVFENNLIMVAFRMHARLEGEGKLTSLIKILLDKEFEYEDKKHTFEFNPYALGGFDGHRDIVSVIHKNNANSESLSLLYSHPNIDPKKFVHKRNYIVGSAIRGEVDFLNLYLEFNAEKVNPKHAQKALEYLSEKFNEEKHKTANLELIERLREIAYK